MGSEAMIITALPFRLSQYLAIVASRGAAGV
jgi:hypothetical protein